MRYAIVIEQTDNNYAAYCPDVDGCIATGATVEEVKALLTDALRLHLRDEPPPTALTTVDYVEVALP